MICVSSRLFSKSRYRFLTLENNKDFEVHYDRRRRLEDSSEESYYVYLFQSSDRIKNSCSVETGFFSGCCHLDKHGLYHKSVLHEPEAQEEINSFEYDEDIYDLIIEKKVRGSKYRQPKKSIDWTGVVFASQNPNDRSVKAVTKKEIWYEKLEECARYYGKSLLVKLHPWNVKRDNAEEKIRRLCEPYGCTVGYFNHSCIENCEFCILGCSSFSVDCMLRGVPVKQLFKGYFHSCDAITFCDGDVTKPLRTDVDVIQKGKQLANFLAQRYCFRMDIPYEGWVSIIKAFYEKRNTREPFLLPQEHSYYSFLKEQE